MSALCLSVSLSLAASLNVKTFGDGTATLVCRATDVLTMQWSISYLAISRTLNLEMILDSATEDLPITEGITLSSTVTSQDTNPSIQSTMSVSSGPSRVENIIVTFVCSGTTRSGGSFRNEAAISVALPNPITSPPTTTATAPVTPQTSGQELLPSPSSSKFTQCVATWKYNYGTLDPIHSHPNTADPARFNDTTEDVESVTVERSPTPTLSLETSSDNGTELLGILWIVLTAVAVLIMGLVGVSVLVCCIVCTCRACRKRAPASEEVHYYDSIDLHGIYTETTSATDRDGVLHIPLGSLETEAYYTSINDETHPHVAVTTGDRPQDIMTAVHTGRVKMSENVAYWNREKLVNDNLAEYI